MRTDANSLMGKSLFITQYVTWMMVKVDKTQLYGSWPRLVQYRTANMAEIPPFTPINLPLVLGCQSTSTGRLWM
jgi:hypothetical protein